MTRKLMTLLLTLALSLALSACVKDLMLRMDSEEFTKVAKEALTHSDQTFDGLIKSDRDLWVALYTLDRDCLPPEFGPVFIYTDPPEFDEWCVRSAATGAIELKAVVTYQSIESQKQLVRALLSYVTALTNAVATKSKRADHFADASADLGTFFEALDKESPLDDTRTKAVKGLLDFVSELERDAASAKAIRAILKAKGATATADFTTLQNALTGVETFTDANLSTVRDLANVAMKFGELDAFARGRLMDAYHSSLDRNSLTALKNDVCLKKADKAGAALESPQAQENAREDAKYAAKTLPRRWSRRPSKYTRN